MYLPLISVSLIVSSIGILNTGRIVETYKEWYIMLSGVGQEYNMIAVFEN